MQIIWSVHDERSGHLLVTRGGTVTPFAQAVLIVRIVGILTVFLGVLLLALHQVQFALASSAMAGLSQDLGGSMAGVFSGAWVFSVLYDLMIVFAGWVLYRVSVPIGRLAARDLGP
jgi:hypothetical protein